MKIYFANDEGTLFMGTGLLHLLQEIDHCKSIHVAAEHIGLSYVKALKILNRLEENLPEKVVERRRGGNERGGADLTDFGKRFVNGYREFSRRVSDFAFAEFKAVESELFESKSGKQDEGSVC